jgi:glycosyl hydrolase family 16
VTGSMGEQPPAASSRLDRDGLELVFSDGFGEGRLDPSRWVDHYLPHWTTAERSAAHYVLEGDCVRLLVAADQPAWRTQDGPMRVSNLQTGSFSGPRGSSLGQHRHRHDLRVVSPQPTRRLWTPSSGVVEARMAASADPTCMLAIWLVGFEEASPLQSGELCIAELYGNAIGPGRSSVRMGIKAHHDPHLRTDMADLVLDLDATEEHTYAAEWDTRDVRFFVDDLLVRTIEQTLAYPLQLMVDLFEFPVGDDREADRYPKSATVRTVRGYRRTGRRDPG